MTSALSNFDRQWKLRSTEADAPVFIFSAGWRSGSTLLQRLICSSEEVLVWGEAYARCGLIQKLSDSTKSLTVAYPHSGHFPGLQASDLKDKWIANVFPSPADMKSTYRSAIDAFLYRPVLREGYARFGLKEVRLDADHGRFLQWIYPDARFFCLVRNPWDAWQSAKGLELYASWPDTPINTAQAFAEHWLKMVESFADWREESVFFFRYEDLIGHPNSVRAVQAHAQLDTIDPMVLQKVVGASQSKVPLTPDEVATIEQIAGSAARQLGYGPLGGLQAA